jgi:hypothetical protein
VLMEISKLELHHKSDKGAHLQPPLMAWFLGGHPAHLHESQAQAWELGPQLLQVESQLARSTPA